MTTTSCEITARARSGAGADPMEAALREVAGEMVRPISAGAGAVDARGMAVRVARVGGLDDASGLMRARTHAGRGRVRGGLWRAAAVSACVHAMIGVGAATIVLNRPERVDRRDAVLSIEMEAWEGMEMVDGSRVEDRSPLERAVIEPGIGAARDAELGEPVPEEGVEAEGNTEVVVQAVAVATPERAQRARVIVAHSLTGWIAGPHEDERAEWRAFGDGEALAGDAVGEAEPTGAREGREGIGGTVEFAGASTPSATSVVYVVDASGPMLTSMRLVLEELLRSVWRLDAGQSFNVVLFREDRGGGGDRSEPFADELVVATDANKRALARWLSGARAEGRSNPLVGLEAGLGFDPEVVFLLSRSVERSAGGVWGEGFSATMARLERLNPVVGADGRSVQIQSIAFLEDDPTGTLQAIAERHGPRDGTGYRVVHGAEELGRKAR